MSDGGEQLEISWYLVVKKFEDAFDQAYNNSSASKLHLDTCKVSIEGAGSRWVNVIMLDCIIAYAKEGFGLHKSRDKRRFNQFAILDSCVCSACAVAMIDRQMAVASRRDAKNYFGPSVVIPYPQRSYVDDIPSPWESVSSLFQNLLSATGRSSKAKRQKIMSVLQVHVPNDAALVRLLNFVCSMIYGSVSVLVPYSIVPWFIFCTDDIVQHFHSHSFVARCPSSTQSLLSTALFAVLEKYATLRMLERDHSYDRMRFV
jgi:hypothetical protein